MPKPASVLLVTAALLGCHLHLSYGIPLLVHPDTSSVDYDSEVVEVPSNNIDSVELHHSDDIIDLGFYGGALFGTPDRGFTSALVANYSAETSLVNPEELGSYLEGDILFPISLDVPQGRNGVVKQTSRWPRGIVPFEINGAFNAFDMDVIEKALNAYHDHTCIRFVRHTTEPDYISIESDNSGCWSAVGRVGGKQIVNLHSTTCFTRLGTPIHELMHALGFLHEQSREERDNFVEIRYENIKSKEWSNFQKANRTVAFGVPYDYGSVMHYSDHAFSKNGQPTIVARLPELATRMGQREGFSAFDVEKLNKMYCDGGVAPVAGPPLQLFPGGGPLVPPAPEVPDKVVESFVGGFINGLVNGGQAEARPALNGN